MAVNTVLRVEGTIVEACPDCGARLGMSVTCQSMFDVLLAVEFSDPAYGEVHFLTVASFMIQHNCYSDAALAWIWGRLHAYREDHHPLSEIQRFAMGETKNALHSWKVLRFSSDQPLLKIARSVTIANVAEQAGDAACSRRAVRLWGESILEQMDVLVNGQASYDKDRDQKSPVWGLYEKKRRRRDLNP